MNAILNPKGRMAPAAFRNVSLALIAISAVLSLLTLLNPLLGMLSLLSLVLIYPWIVIWVKRFHDAGKSGWMFLAVLVPWLAVSTAASMVIAAQFAPAAPAAAPGDFSAMMTAMAAQTSATLIPNLVASTIISLVFVFGANLLLKSDPGANQYGPPAGK